MSNTILIKRDEAGVALGKLMYGTYIEYNGSYYIKVDKRKLGEGVRVDYPPNTCVLCNVKLGTLRAVDGSTKVIQVFDTEITLFPVSFGDIRSYTK